MNKVVVFLAVLVLSMSAFAGQKNLEFAWEQTLSPDLLKWNLYYSETAGGPYTLLTNIVYTGDPGPQFASDPIIFTSPDGQVVAYYFVLTAEDASGNESGYSNEVSETIDFEAPDVPFTFTVIVVAD